MHQAQPPPDAKTRFSSRVEDYVRYRPGYPDALYDFLKEQVPLGNGSSVAELGSGTGIFAGPLLKGGCTVFGVEPNAEMRAAAERLLGDRYSRFQSVNGSAEATTLSDRSADLAVAAQAFHWFDPAKTAAECRRILRGNRVAALVWNTRKTRGSPFLEGYEALLNEFGTDYGNVRHDRADEGRLRLFFSPGYRRAAFPSDQRLDLAGLRGRLLSSSYTPGADDPARGPMLDALERLFARHSAAGHVVLEYDTEVYLGPVVG
jgi:SAM-dependent methyltransferase